MIKLSQSLALLITVCQWLPCLSGPDLITVNWKIVIESEFKVEVENKAGDSVTKKTKEDYMS